MNLKKTLLDNKYFYLYASLIPILIGFIGVIFLLQAPYTGLHFEKKNDKWYISSIDTGSPASVHPELIGKEIASIGTMKVDKNTLIKSFLYMCPLDEVQIYFAQHQYLHEYVKTDQPISVTVTDIGTSNIVIITPSTFPVLVMIQHMWIPIFAGGISLFLGLLIVFKKTGEIFSRIYFLWECLVIILTIEIGILISYDIAFDANILIIRYFLFWFAYILMLPVVTHFFLTFPRDVFQVSDTRWAIYTLYILALVVFLLSSFRLSLAVFPVFILLLVIGACIIFTAMYFRLDPIEKIQMKWIYMGFIISILSGLLYVFPIILFGHSMIPNVYIFLLFITLPISVAFSILRYKLMDIDTLFDNTLVYSLTIAILAIIDIVVVTFLTTNHIPLLQFTTPITTVIAVWIIIFTYLPIRNFVQKWIKKLLKREIYDTNKLSMQLSKELLSVQSIQEAFQKMSSLISDALHPKGGSAHFSNEHGSIHVFGNASVDISIIDEHNTKEIAHPSPLYQITRVISKDYNNGIYVPIIGRNKRKLGYLLLQEKHSGRLYDKSDIKLLNITSAQLAMTIETLMAIENKDCKKEKINIELSPTTTSYLAKIYTLGDFQILRDEQFGFAVGKVQKKPLELIKLMIALGGNRIPHEIITDHLWPDAEGDYAYHTLVTNIQRARQLLGHKNSIIFQAGKVSINTELVWVDCIIFKQMFENEIGLFHNKQDGEVIKIGSKILSLYKGHFFADEQYPWIISMREQLKTHFYLLGEHVGTCYEKQDQHWEDISRYYNAMIEIDDSVELFYRKLMALYTKLDRVEDAIKTYQRYEKVLHAKLGLMPSHQIQNIYLDLVQKHTDRSHK